MRFLPKLVYLLFVICYLLFVSPPAFAQSNEQAVPNNLHNYTQQVLLDLSSGLICQIAGIDPIGQPCLTYDLNGKLGFLGPGPNVAGGEVGGAIGTMGSLIAVTYTPPASTGDYFRYLAHNFGIVKSAYAAPFTGIGFQGLTPLLGIWTVFRNLVYLFFVIAFVLVGFAIMLRVRIDPRTVMTIQNQIPKLIIALILVTFSYAIAGFLIDLMYITTYLIFNIAGQAAPAGSDLASKLVHTQTTVQGDTPFGVLNNLVGFRDIVTNAAGGVKDIVQNLFGTAVSGDSTTGPSEGRPFISGLINVFAFAGDTIRNAMGALLGLIAGVLALLIIAIAILWALFRLWFELIKAYVYILIDVVFAPLWILVGVFPGGAMGFGAWLRDIIANLSAFPTTIVMFLLGKLFMDTFGPAPVTGQFVPPLIGNPGQLNAIGALIGLGIILMTPQVVNMIKEAIKAPQNKFGVAIGQAVGTGAGVPTTGIKTGLEARLTTPHLGERTGFWRAIVGRFGR